MLYTVRIFMHKYGTINKRKKKKTHQTRVYITLRYNKYFNSSYNNVRSCVSSTKIVIRSIKFQSYFKQQLTNTFSFNANTIRFTRKFI